MSDDEEHRDLVVAVAGLIQHTGATEFQLRYSDEEQPVVWLAVAVYTDQRAEAAAALTPHLAAWRLAERLVDGGTCAVCGRPSALAEDETEILPAAVLCEYRYRGGKFRRGCDSLPVGTRA